MQSSWGVTPPRATPSRVTLAPVAEGGTCICTKRPSDVARSKAEASATKSTLAARTGGGEGRGGGEAASQQRGAKRQPAASTHGGTATGPPSGRPRRCQRRAIGSPHEVRPPGCQSRGVHEQHGHAAGRRGRRRRLLGRAARSLVRQQQQRLGRGLKLVEHEHVAARLRGRKRRVSGGGIEVTAGQGRMAPLTRRPPPPRLPPRAHHSFPSPEPPDRSPDASMPRACAAPTRGGRGCRGAARRP